MTGWGASGGPPTIEIPLDKIGFAQDSVSPRFKNGDKITTLRDILGKLYDNQQSAEADAEDEDAGPFTAINKWFCSMIIVYLFNCQYQCQS